MIKPYVRNILILLILSDVVYSFVQHLNMPVDGDFTAIVLPSDHYKKVLNDPLATGVLLKGEVYAAPNRFFVHWTMSHYFKTFPLFLQYFTTPVKSVYWSIAIAKIIIQLFLIWLLAFLISEGAKFRSDKLLLAAVLVIPLFQTSGHYYNSMGVIEQSVTYTFFYTLPVSMTLCFFLPFIFIDSWKWTPLRHLIWLSLTIILPLSGPLVPGIVLVGFFVLLLGRFFGYNKKEKDFSLSHWLVTLYPSGFLGPFIYFMLICLFSFYSLYVGRSNEENLSHSISLAEGFVMLPQGIFKVVFQKLGLPLILLWISFNSLIIRKNEDKNHYYFLLKWFGIFALFYLLLLPVGGYRDYRPLIIRRDTFLPLTLGMFFFLGYSTLLVLKQLKVKIRVGYSIALIGLLGVFTMADSPEFDKNACEKTALELLGTTEEEVIFLEKDCNVMSWSLMGYPKQSTTTANMLYHWNITRSVQLFYQEQ